MSKVYFNPLGDVDPRMISEAFRRARARAADEVSSDTLLSAILHEARAGARDMFGLVRAGDRAAAMTSLDAGERAHLV